MLDEKNRALGHKIASLAKLKKKTQYALAENTRMSRISINRFFNGHTQVRAEDLVAVLKNFDIDIDKLLDDKIKEHYESIGGMYV